MNYALLVLTTLALVLSFDLTIGGGLVKKTWFYKALGIFLGTTLIFNTYLTATPIVTYSTVNTLNIRLGTIPVEDFVYAAALILFALSALRIKKVPPHLVLTIFKSIRPISWVNTTAPPLAVFLIASGSLTLAPTHILILLYFLIPYNTLLYGINDIFDFESDRINSRKKGVQGHLLSPKYHPWMIFFALLTTIPFLTWAFITLTLSTFLLICAAVLIAIVYAAPPIRIKSRPVLDTITSALHFTIPILVAASAAQFHIDILIVFAFFLWSSASHILGAIPDISADKKAGMHTIAIVLGANKAALLTSFLYAGSVVLLFTSAIPLLIPLTLIPYILNSLSILTQANHQEAEKNFRFFIYYNLVAGAIITNVILFTYLI